MFRPYFLAMLFVFAPVLVKAQTQSNSVPRAQIVANAEREFVRIDTDKDSAISRAELDAFQSASILKTVDAANAAAFARLDEDKNGQLSAREFGKINPAPKADVTVAFRADTNKDNKISLAEHRAATVEKFNSLDGNKDGLLTAEEVRAASAAAKK
jgi:Ca2+-binding EF-hand superfamily protein